MDSAADYVAFALVFIAGAATILTAMSAINRALALRRIRRAGTLVATEGTLHAIEPRHVSQTGRAQAASYWTIDATYDYEVGGKRFAGDRFALDHFSWLPDEATATEAAARYRPGERVTVWYDPAAPDFAILDRTERASPDRQRTLAVVFAALALVSAVAAVLFIALRA